MRLFWKRHTHRVTITRITSAFADYCAFVTYFVKNFLIENSELKYNFKLKILKKGNRDRKWKSMQTS